MICRLFRSHSPGANFFLDNGMIFSLTKEFAVSGQTIKSRVAHVADGGDVAVEVQRYDCRGHV